jgi:Ca2+-binding EF-hand superfamily protein
MRDLRMKIKVDNIDLERLFKRLGFNNQTEMKINDFEKFLAMVSPNLSVEEVRYIFEKLDTDKNNTITYQEL